MMASWASCAARVTARVGLACVDDLSAEVPGLSSAMSKFQASRREEGDDPNTATSQRALALSRVNKATQDLRDLVTVPVVQAPPDSFNSLSATHPVSPVCAAGSRCKKKTGNVTERSAEPSLTRKANTPPRTLVDTPYLPDTTL